MTPDKPADGSYDRQADIGRLAYLRDENFARIVLAILGVAVETHPEEIRAALAQVFDLRAVRANSDKTAQQNFLMYQDYLSLKDRLAEVEKRLEHQQTQLSTLQHVLSKVRQWLKKEVYPRVNRASSSKSSPKPGTN